MDPQQERSNASSTFLPMPKAPRFINIPLRLKYILLPILSDQARQIGQVLPRLSSTPFRERNNRKWGSETRGPGEPKDFSVVALAHYPRWIGSQDWNMQLNTVRKDPEILLKTLGYAHGDESRRWYFITDFEVDYEDTNGVAKPLPRAVYPGTQIAVLPTKQGILFILREASAGGGSGFVHFGGHGRYTYAGTSGIMDEPTGKIRYTETPNGSPIKEAFIVTTLGERLYGSEFIESLGDGTDERCGTTLTVSLDMCDASAFFDGIVKMPYQYRGEGTQEPDTTTRSTNQLVVISASQPGQTAGEFGNCGAMTFFLTEALLSKDHGGQGLSAVDEIIRYIHGECQKQPNKRRLQTPQITSRYKLTGRFGLLPATHSML